MIDIEKIEAAYQKATPGEWGIEPIKGYRSDMLVSPECVANPHKAIAEFDCGPPLDLPFVVAIHNAWPQIQRELAEKDAEIATLKEIAKEYSQLCRHMDAGGDFFEFQSAKGQK